MKRDLTSGSVFKNVVAFSLPYLLSYFLQTLYGMADLFIIGQYEGIAATTAVSVGSQVMHMLTVMLVGLAMGSTVSIGQAVGAKDPRSVSAAIGNTVTLFLGLSVVLTGVLLALNGSIVRLMSTPQAAAEGARTYLTICFLGIPFITAYIISSAPFSAVWATAKAPCSSLPRPAPSISSWIFCLWARCTWAPPARRWGRRFPSASASLSRCFSSGGSTASPSPGQI